MFKLSKTVQSVGRPSVSLCVPLDHIQTDPPAWRLDLFPGLLVLVCFVFVCFTLGQRSLTHAPGLLFISSISRPPSHKQLAPVCQAASKRGDPRQPYAEKELAGFSNSVPGEPPPLIPSLPRVITLAHRLLYRILACNAFLSTADAR